MRVFFIVLLVAATLSAENAGVLLKRGNKAYEAGRLDEALKCYEEALVESPENPYVIFNRAVVQFKKGEFEKAKAEFQSAIDKLPNLKRSDSSLEERARTAMGDCCFSMARPIVESEVDNALKLCLESIASYETALRLNPKSMAASSNIKSARMLLKKILGIKYAQAQQQKQQQELAQKLKELAERQRKAADNTAKASGSDSLKDEQEAISRETEEIAGKLQPPQQQQPQQQAENPLKQARDEQDAAMKSLDSNELPEAEKHQRAAADKLEELLKQNEQQQQQQQQEGNDKQEQQQDGSDKQEQQQQDGSDKQEEQEQQQDGDDKQEQQQQDGSDKQEEQEEQQATAAQEQKQEESGEQEAREIIDRERHDKRERDEKNRRGTYRAVPMDW